MKIHLTTVVGAYVDVLPHMLAHYRSIGVDSFLVNVNSLSQHDPMPDRVRQITEDFGCGIASVTVGPWRQTVNPKIYQRSRQEHPDDWFLQADQDELQIYPSSLRKILSYCDAEGYDYVEGGFLDRLSSDGAFSPVVAGRSIWEQFPLGGFITSPILGGNTNKIVAAKGHVRLGPGQHTALDGKGCPAQICYAQVHHFKWTEGIVQRLKQRVAFYKSQHDPLWGESWRFLEYVRTHDGRIDINDPLFKVTKCSPGYPFWDEVQHLR